MARYGQRGPTGMGGWLAVFVATLLLNAVGALIVWSRVLSLHIGPALQSYIVTISVAGLLRGMGYGGLAWVLIRQRRPASVRLTIGGLWVLALSAPIVELLARVLLFSGEPLFGGSKLGNAVLAPLGYAAIWTVYLLRSDRVANTYAPRDDSLADVFG